MSYQKKSAKLMSLFYEGKVGILVQRGAKYGARKILDEAYAKGIKTAYHNGRSLDSNYYYASQGDVIFVIRDNQLVVLNGYGDRYKDGANVSFPNKDDLYIELLGIAYMNYDTLWQRVNLENTWNYRTHIEGLDKMVESMVRKEVFI